MATRWWSSSTIAVVTGANKGIGLEIVRQLALQGVTVVLAARDEERGKAAVEDLKAGGVTGVVFQQLDVSSKDSIDRFAAWIKAEYGGFDILVNNAGILFRLQEIETAKQTMDVNYRGLVNVTEAMLPLLRPSPAKARIVNMGSILGQRNQIPGLSLRERFGDERMTKEDVDKLVDEYLLSIENGDFEEQGWGGAIFDAYAVSKCYGVSKMAVIAYTFILDRQLAARDGPGKTLVNAVHPGYVKTDMAPSGILSVQEGADTAVWLALAPSDSPSGKFFFDRKEMEY